jgi:hypothetical protein
VLDSCYNDEYDPIMNMRTITVHKQDGTTYNIAIPEFHGGKYYEISLSCKDPESYVNTLISQYENIKEDFYNDLEMFPGDTNFIGNSIFCIIESIDESIKLLKNINSGAS